MVINFCCCDQRRVSSWTATTLKLQLKEMELQVASHSSEVKMKSTGAASLA